MLRHHVHWTSFRFLCVCVCVCVLVTNRSRVLKKFDPVAVQVSLPRDVESTHSDDTQSHDDDWWSHHDDLLQCIGPHHSLQTTLQQCGHILYIPFAKFLLERLMLAQLIKQSPAFYVTRRSITVSTVPHRYISEANESNPHVYSASLFWSVKTSFCYLRHSPKPIYRVLQHECCVSHFFCACYISRVTKLLTVRCFYCSMTEASGTASSVCLLDTALGHSALQQIAFPPSSTQSRSLSTYTRQSRHYTVHSAITVHFTSSFFVLPHLSCRSVRQLSQDVPAVAGFLCDKPAVLTYDVKESPCVKPTLSYPYARIEFYP